MKFRQVLKARFERRIVRVTASFDGKRLKAWWLRKNSSFSIEELFVTPVFRTNNRKRLEKWNGRRRANAQAAIARCLPDETGLYAKQNNAWRYRDGQS